MVLTCHSPPIDRQRPPVNKCGVNAVYILLRVCDVNVALQSIESEIAMTRAGASVAELARVCSTAGLPVAALRIDRKQIRRVRPPYIAHLNRPTGGQESGHYVVVVSCRRDAVSAIDGTTGERVSWTPAAFQRTWTGIVVAPRPGMHTLGGVNGARLGMVLICVGCALFVGHRLVAFSDRRRNVPFGVVLAVSLGNCMQARAGGYLDFPLEPVENPWRHPACDAVNCMYVFARLQGCDVAYEDVAVTQGYGDAASIGGMIQTLEALGVPGDARKLLPSELTSEILPAIVHLDFSSRSKEMSVLLAVNQGEYYVLHGGPATIEKLSKDELMRSWSGVAILRGRRHRLGPLPVTVCVAVSLIIYFCYRHSRSKEKTANA